MPGGRRARARIDDDELRKLFAEGETDERIAERFDTPGVDASYVFRRRMELRLLRRPGAPKGSRKARHGSHSLAGKGISIPAVDNPAFVERRTLYPSTVRDVSGLTNLLVSGDNSKKIGSQITKGPLRGFPIYTLTLEERATCPTSCQHWRSCLPPETKVLTADLRWIEIGSLKHGQKIVGFDESPDPETKRRRTRIAHVQKLGRAIMPSYRIFTDKGEIVASADHRWLARRVLTSQSGRDGYSWIETRDLKPADTIQYLVKPWEEDRSYDAGRIRGFVEGEGSVGADGNNGWAKARLNWAQRPGKLLREINELIAARGFAFTSKIKKMGVRDTDCTVNDLLGGWREVIRFLGTFRPTRLIERAPEILIGHALDGRGSTPAKVYGIEFVGDREVVMIETTTQTLIAEGFASHNCYGNNMHLAKRARHGADFETRLAAELAVLQSRHPGGFAVRLHVLGDFYSVEYVRLWASFLDRFRSLFVFGFTARWRREDPIAVELLRLVVERRERFAIRFSNAPVDEDSTVSIEHPIQKPADAVICPAQLGRTESCGTCGLCWHSRRRVAFLQH